MKIQPIVEGHGEVHAVPVLLRRLRDASGAFEIDVLRPARHSRFDLADEAMLRHIIRRTLEQKLCHGILILFDGDDACPRELAPRVQSWATEEAGTVPCAVVIAQREYESWLLASIESLRGQHGVRTDAIPPPDPESVRGAKEKIANNLREDRLYKPTSDQAALTFLFDMAAAYRSCRSFRRMVRAFGLLAEGAGIPLKDWPPPSWLGPGEDLP